jgi:hypothetical protein
VSAFVLYFMCATTLFGQTPLPSGQVSGHVIDTVGAVIPGADVFVRSYSARGKDITLAGHTDRNGDFTLTLPAGGYDVIVTSPGFQSKIQIVLSKVGKTTKILWKLAALNCDFPSTNCDTFQ